MNKTVLGVIAVALIFAIAAYFGFFRKGDSELNLGNSQENTNQENTQETQAPVDQSDNQNSQNESQAVAKATAVIETSMGNITVDLDGTVAPKTVANFIKLAEEDFYKGLTFHRIVKNFVIQGGDPDGDGTGGPGYTIPAEINLKHTKGAIAMARQPDAVNPAKASSGSQFYIALQNLPSLDGQYTVFGYVTAGMDVVDKIAEVPTEPGDIPLQKITINKVTISEKK